MAYNFNKIFAVNKEAFAVISNSGQTNQYVFVLKLYDENATAFNKARIFSERFTIYAWVDDTSYSGKGVPPYSTSYLTASYYYPNKELEFTKVTIGSASYTTASGILPPIVPTGLALGMIPNNSPTNVDFVLASWENSVIGDLGDNDYQITYTDTNGTTQTATFTKVNANQVFGVLYGIDINLSKTITVKAVKSITITNNVDNTTYEVSKSGDYSGTITLKANDGYKIDNATIYYLDDVGDPITANMEISSDGKSATFTSDAIDMTASATLNGTTSQTTVEPTFTNNIPNTTYTYSGSDHQYTVVITANDGYLFEGTPEASYTGYSSDTPISVSFVVSSDKKTASGICPDVDENTPIVLTGNTEEEKVITVVNNITGTTETHTFDGTNLSVTVKGTTGNKRFRTAQLVYTDTDGSTVTVDMTISIIDDIPTATAQVTEVKNNTTASVNGTYENTTTCKTTLSNCTVDNHPSNLFSGETWTVVVTANANCLFETVPVFSYDNKDGDYVTQELTVSEDTKTATGTFTVPNDYTPQECVLTATATPQTIIGSNYGAINVYKVTLDNLEAFSKKRFFKEAINSDGTEFTLINLGDYVNRIKRLFFTVPVASTDVIKCGNYNTNVECEAPETDTVTLNFGTITVPSPNGDTTDYLSELKLFVPFNGFVSIPVDYIGKTLSLVYTVNVITGGGVAKVLCGENVVLLVDVEPNEDIIYQTNLDNLATVGGDDWNEQLLYGIEPFLNVRYYNSLNKDTRNTDYINGKLGDLSGFCVVDDITLSTTAEMTVEEQERIISLLKGGVYIEQ